MDFLSTWGRRGGEAVVDRLAWKDSPYSFPIPLYHSKRGIRSPSLLSAESPAPIMASQPGSLSDGILSCQMPGSLGRQKPGRGGESLLKAELVHKPPCPTSFLTTLRTCLCFPPCCFITGLRIRGFAPSPVTSLISE